VGLGLALLLNGKSKVLDATRTVFLIPMVLPPIVVALIWKIIYTPDVSPMHRALEALGLPVRSLIANPDTALWAITAGRHLAVVPVHHADGAGALQMIPDDPLEAAASTAPTAGSCSATSCFPLHPPGAGGVRLFRLIDSFKAFPLIYVLTNGGPGT
jgi:multiple sugar transport system permease protein